jgi:hypothetical protein
MSQQSAIFAAMLIGFVVYITMRGRLPAYVALFWTKAATPISTTGTSAQPTVPTLPTSPASAPYLDQPDYNPADGVVLTPGF